MMQPGDAGYQNLHSTARLLIFVALAFVAGRIAVVSSNSGLTAFQGANDSSRWSTVVSLVEHGTYAIDTQEDIIVTLPGGVHAPWATADKVQHLGLDGAQHFYSSKPPLFSTLVAGVYAVVHSLSGMTLTDYPKSMIRVVLALVNLPLLALFYFATTSSIIRISRNQWAAQVGIIVVCFGTMLLPFAITLNNHLPAAAATAAALWIYLFTSAQLAKGAAKAKVSGYWWFGAGLSAAMAAANELPALSMLVFWGILFLILERSSVLPFLAGVLVVLCGFFGTNWIAHQSLRPAYAHRGHGEVIAEFVGNGAPNEQYNAVVAALVKHRGIEGSPELDGWESRVDKRWVISVGDKQFALLDTEPVDSLATVTTKRKWILADWDDWYDYPGSYWVTENLRGIDRGEPSRFIYFVNMTIGHHGVFSLTPILLILPFALISGLRTGPPGFRRLVLAVLLATLVCMFFYVARPEIDRNYGGVSVCFRWLLWFTPLWLLVLVPVFDRLAERRAHRIGLTVLLVFSVFSVMTALSSPWSHPWLYKYWSFLGLLG